MIIFPILSYSWQNRSTCPSHELHRHPLGLPHSEVFLIQSCLVQKQPCKKEPRSGNVLHAHTFKISTQLPCLVTGLAQFNFSKTPRPCVGTWDREHWNTFSSHYSVFILQFNTVSQRGRVNLWLKSLPTYTCVEWIHNFMLKASPLNYFLARPIIIMGYIMPSPQVKTLSSSKSSNSWTLIQIHETFSLSCITSSCSTLRVIVRS